MESAPTKALIDLIESARLSAEKKIEEEKKAGEEKKAPVDLLRILARERALFGVEKKKHEEETPVDTSDMPPLEDGDDASDSDNGADSEDIALEELEKKLLLALVNNNASRLLLDFSGLYPSFAIAHGLALHAEAAKKTESDAPAKPTSLLYWAMTQDKEPDPSVVDRLLCQEPHLINTSYGPSGERALNLALRKGWYRSVRRIMQDPKTELNVLTTDAKTLLFSACTGEASEVKVQLLSELLFAMQRKDANHELLSLVNARPICPHGKERSGRTLLETLVDPEPNGPHHYESVIRQYIQVLLQYGASTISAQGVPCETCKALPIIKRGVLGFAIMSESASVLDMMRSRDLACNACADGEPALLFALRTHAKPNVIRILCEAAIRDPDSANKVFARAERFMEEDKQNAAGTVWHSMVCASLAVLWTRIQRATEENSALRKAITECNDLRMERDELGASNRALAVQVDLLKKNLADNVRYVDQTTKAMEYQNAGISRLRNELDTASKDRDTNLRALSDANIRNRDLQAQLETAKKDKEKVGLQVAQLQADCNKYEKLLNQMGEEIDRLEAVQSSHTLEMAKTDSLQKELVQVERAYAELRDHSRKQNIYIGKLNEELAELRKPPALASTTLVKPDIDETLTGLDLAKKTCDDYYKETGKQHYPVDPSSPLGLRLKSMYSYANLPIKGGYLIVDEDAHTTEMGNVFRFD